MSFGSVLMQLVLGCSSTAFLLAREWYILAVPNKPITARNAIEMDAIEMLLLVAVEAFEFSNSLDEDLTSLSEYE